MAYLKSSQVKVFPSAFRGNDINPESFLTTEANLKEPVLSTYHKTYAYKDDSGNYVLCLKGYRFYDISFANIITALGSISDVDAIWAGIRIADIASSYSGVSIPTLVANTDDGSGTNHILDNSDSGFTGLLFATTEEELTNCTEKIKLFERVSSGSSEDNFKIPDAYSLLVTSKQVSNGNTKTPIAQEFTTGSLSVTTATIMNANVTTATVTNANITNATLTNVDASTATITDISADTVTTKEMTSGTQYGNYGTCDSVSTAQTKVVSISNFKLVEGVHIFVKFTNTDTSTISLGYPKLNVNSTGAKSIRFGSSYNYIADNNRIKAGDVYEFVYDGTNWILLGCQEAPQVYGSLLIWHPNYGTPDYVFNGSTAVNITTNLPLSSYGNPGDILVSRGNSGTALWKPANVIGAGRLLLNNGTVTTTENIDYGGIAYPIYFKNGIPMKCHLTEHVNIDYDTITYHSANIAKGANDKSFDEISSSSWIELRYGGLGGSSLNLQATIADFDGDYDPQTAPDWQGWPVLADISMNLDLDGNTIKTNVGSSQIWFRFKLSWFVNQILNSFGTDRYALFTDGDYQNYYSCVAQLGASKLYSAYKCNTFVKFKTVTIDNTSTPCLFIGVNTDDISNIDSLHARIRLFVRHTNDAPVFPYYSN